MIQRLLRGSLVYWILALIVVALWTRMGGVRRPSAEAFAQVRTAFQTHEPFVPDQQQLERGAQQAPLVAGALWLWFLFIISLGISGLAVTLHAVWTGRIRLLWQPAMGRFPPWKLGEVVRIIALLVLMVLLFPYARLAILTIQLSSDANPSLWIVAPAAVIDVFAIATVISFARGKGRSVSELFGLSGDTAWQSIRIGLYSYVAIIPWVLALIVLSVMVVRTLHLPVQMEPIQELLFKPGEPWILAMTFVLACIIGPLAEELFFRGVLYPATRQRMSSGVAMLVNGAVFSLAHTNLIGFLPILLLGCLLANVYERTSSLAGSMAVHIAHNTLLMSAALLLHQLIIAGQ